MSEPFQSALAGWSRRRRVVTLVLTPVMAWVFVAISGNSLGETSVLWLLLVAVAAVEAAAVLASYLPHRGLRPELGCTPCAAVAAVTVVGAMLALNNYGSSNIGPALAIAVMLFGLTQRLTQTQTCATPAPRNTAGKD